MNFISWNNRLINESVDDYYVEQISVLEESIAKTLKPVMNKMKKLNIGLPYRDARIFFFNYLKEKHPELVPAGFEKKKPSAKDVNAIVGQIAIDNPDMLDKFAEEFETYASEDVPGTDEDRLSQFLRVAMILRTGKGVRPKKDEGFKKKEYSGLTAQEIKQTTMDAVEKAPVDKGEDADVQDEKLLLKAALAKVLNQMAESEDIDPKIIENITTVGGKIDTVSKFKKFLDYMHQYEEYHVAEQYLRGMLEVIEKSLSQMGENEEELDDFITGPQSDENIPPEYEADMQSIMAGKFPESKHTGGGISSKMILRAAEKLAEALSQLEGQEFKIHDGTLDATGFDLDTAKEGAYAGGTYTVQDDGSIVNMALPHKPVYGFVNDSVDDIIETIKTLKLSDEDDNDQYAPEDSPEDDNMGQMEPLDDEDAEVDAKKSDLNKDGKLSEYEKKRGQAIADAMEEDKKEEEEDDRISSYLKLQKAKENLPKMSDKEEKEEKKEEDEQIALSPQEIARQMQVQRQQEMQNFYRQERLNRYGY